MINKININTIEDLKLLKSRTGFDDIDIEFAKFISQLNDDANSILILTAALASYAFRNNNICLRLEDYTEKEFPFEFDDGMDFEQNYTILPTLENWLNELHNFSKVISFREEIKPLIIDNKNRLYIQRYFKYEQELAQFLSDKIKQNLTNSMLSDIPDIRNISKYFKNDTTISYQQVATFASLINQFTVITGSPGTGKTTVVATILALNYQMNPAFKVGICAPTGKAAARLKESLNIELENLNVAQSIKDKITKTDTSTIHRLLRTKYNTPHFIFGKDKKLNIDMLILDEASMVSQPLMCKLFYALQPTTKIILLGDKDQLASVEEGTVFGDICDSLPINTFSSEFCELYSKSTNNQLDSVKTNLPSNTIIELKKSHRFDSTKGIGLAKSAINIGDADRLLEIGKSNDEELQLKSLPPRNYFNQKILTYIKDLKVNIDDKSYTFEDYLSFEDIDKQFSFMNNFRILCAKRNGIYGVNNINRIIIEHYFDNNDKYADGISVMITSNDSRLKLYNGDIGILRNHRIHFPDLKENGKFRHFSPNQIPEHEIVFAMTIHKSQGSGFQNILLILPQKDSPVLTRELLYTGVTRAKKYCEIWSYDSILKCTISKVTKRDSGLKDNLLTIHNL